MRVTLEFPRMSWTFVLRSHEMESFRRCRRAWDLGARTRQNYVPIAPAHVFDLDKAIHDALAVYYFPAMDDWNRAIVRPLALQGFHRSMREQRALYELTASLTAEQEQEWREQIQLGETVLKGYFEWAATVDQFASIFADQDVWTHIPDPWTADDALAMPDGRSLRYFGRVDQVISDPNDEHWVVDHRISRHGWAETEELLLDLVTLSYVWALEICYPQLKIAGTIHNELRTHAGGEMRQAFQDSALDERDRLNMSRARHVSTRRSPATPIEDEPANRPWDDRPKGDQVGRTEIVKQEGNEQFRRTHIRRSRTAIESIGVQMAMQTLEMRQAEIRLYPNPSEKNCPNCAYRKPCIAMSAGFDPAPILATHYRKRSEEEFEEERLRWSSIRRRTPAAFGSTGWRSTPTP